MKNSLKLLICALALGVMASVPALRAQDEKAPPAQGPGGGKGGKGGGRGQMSPEQRITQIEEAVGKLSADQKTKITALLEKSAKDMQAVPQEERREKGQAIRTATNKEIRAVLTAEQQTKFDAMPQGGPGGGGGGRKKGGGN